METPHGLNRVDMRIPVPPSGGSLEIGNKALLIYYGTTLSTVPPSGGSLEIGNALIGYWNIEVDKITFPLRGDP